MRFLVYAVTGFLILGVTSCGLEGSASYKPPGVPVEFTVDTSGAISIGIGDEIVTPIGTFGIDVEKSLTPKDDESIVTILHYAGGASKKSQYSVKLDETLYVEVNGNAHLKFANRAVEVTAPRGSQTTIKVADEPPSQDDYQEPTCPAKAPAPELAIEPDTGPVTTKIALTGVGFVSDGKVEINFAANYMGEARTDCAGRFTVQLAIPDPDFYRKFPGQQGITTTEHDSAGQYVGNGDSAYFQLTR